MGSCISLLVDDARALVICHALKMKRSPFKMKGLLRGVAIEKRLIRIVYQPVAGKVLLMSLFAQAIHSASHRRSEAFLALNCSAFSRELLESELFGYKAGAFTGAVKDKKGLLEALPSRDICRVSC